MLHTGARTAVILGLLGLAACGGREPDPADPDAGKGGSANAAGSGGSAGSAGKGATGGAGTGGATGGSGGGGGATGGSGGTAGTTGGSGGTGGATGGSGATGGATGGSGGGTTGGSGGSGGSNPDGGPAPYVAQARQRVKKVDLLLMIDNSSSMADKQGVLAKAIPQLVEQFVAPSCIDPVTGKILGRPTAGTCAGGVLAFEPINDIHIGIVTSSIGNHGAAGVCEDNIDVSLGRSDPHNNDQAHLVARGTGGTVVATYQNKGFLYFNPAVAGAAANASAITTPFADMVSGVGQHGCGYEASLEAVYRFLVDPEPYSTIRIDTSIGGYGQALLNGTDDALLRQRADFLRPDSLVSIVLVTDENDCSVIDGAQGFYAILPPIPNTSKSVLKHGTSKCLENPNDTCCFNCGVQSPPPGCPDPSGDPECQKGEWQVVEDQMNLRCFKQKERYGFDFLYPVQRYIDGFTAPQVPNRRGEMVPNPLFTDLTCNTGTGCPSLRDKNLVYVTGLVGVPWQDIAVDPVDLTKGYKTSKQLDGDGVWVDIVGDPTNPTGPVAPRDPHMIESMKPRAGLPGPGSARNADIKHGHEWDPTKDMSQPNADLQYACIFDLPTPRTCSDGADCDCFGPNLADVQNPLCQNAQGAYTSTQLRAKAYPSPRILQVLRGLGDHAIVGSICPAQLTDTSRADYGYSPAFSAMVPSLRQPLASQCLSLALPVDSSGQAPCTIIEAFNAATACNCDGEPGRGTAPAALLTDEIRRAGSCFCEIKQLTGSAADLCRSNLNPPANTGDGWCYVDPQQQSTVNCPVVRDCGFDQKQKIQFINVNSEPRPGSTAFLRCDAQPITPLPTVCP